MNTFKANGYLLGGVVVIHGVLSVINVYVKNDSKKIRYKKLNMKTCLLEDERKMIVNIRKKLLLCYNVKMTI